MTSILLDTCAVIWIGNKDKMAQDAVSAMDNAYDRGERLYVSAITAWELGILVAKGRHRLSKETSVWFQEFIVGSLSQLAPLTPDILIASSYLPGTPPNDPADKIIIATARQYGYRIMTRDKKILEYANEGHVNAIAC